jgi:hypothetical protein
MRWPCREIRRGRHLWRFLRRRRLGSAALTHPGTTPLPGILLIRWVDRR